jgi:transcriptional regulator with PAS, ATPase and Fis domain
MLSEQDLQQLKNRYGIVGNTSSLNFALSTASQVSSTDLTVLIQGESGVGKEVFSQIIHSLSPRKHNPFIAINCGAIPEGTIDSELFGHEKGSFTSAIDARKGYFETVNGGTIFLDEIGEMPIGTQARLLRVLETGEFIRVGSSKVQKTNVRVIAATNRSLLGLVQVGKFREDLYYRLSTVPIRVPALRERVDDIYPLFRKFCIDFADKYRTQPVQFNDEARQMLLAYTWPGNVRELKNIADQISVLAPSKNIDAHTLVRFLPEQNAANLPALSHGASVHNNNEFASERDILYKLFFDMKKDVTELKKVIFDIANNPGIGQNYTDALEKTANRFGVTEANNNTILQNTPTTNTFFSNKEPNAIDTSMVIEETLNIAEKEKELIIKALKKHRSKRRDAASELGISERTLYRKIKEYDIED